MTLTLDQPAAIISSQMGQSVEKTYHDNLITDPLLARALQVILDGISADGRMRASQMREKAGFTLSEAVQLLRYLHRQGVLLLVPQDRTSHLYHVSASIWPALSRTDTLANTLTRFHKERGYSPWFLNSGERGSQRAALALCSFYRRASRHLRSKKNLS